VGKVRIAATFIIKLFNKLFLYQWPTYGTGLKPSTCRKLIAKVVEQEEKYWAEDEQLYEHDFDEISDDEKCATD
jgi:hypothetical protein